MVNEYKIGKKAYSKQFGRTFKGLTNRILQNQKHKSKKRGLTEVEYTLLELRTWLKLQPTFTQLFDNWKISDFNKKLTPSINRLNDYLPYSLTNIELLTWEENDKKGSFDRKTGINRKVSKEVTQYTLNMEKVQVFFSVADTARSTGFNTSNIAACCRGVLKTTNKHIFKYT